MDTLDYFNAFNVYLNDSLSILMTVSRVIMTKLTLHSLDAVEAGGALLGPDHPVRAGDEHVLGAAHRHPVHCEIVCAGVTT